MGIFRDSFVIETRISADDLVSRLQQGLSHPRGWADRLFPATNRPDWGKAGEDGFFLVWRYFKMSIRFGGEFGPRGDGQPGSRVSVRMYSLGWTELILYACLFVPVALPVLLCVAYGCWVLSLGNRLGLIFVLPPLVMGSVIFGFVCLGSIIAMSGARARFLDWFDLLTRERPSVVSIDPAGRSLEGSS
jgi:hypothetical protein